MDNYLKYNTSKGIVVPDTTELVQDTWNAYKAIFGQDLSTEEASPQGRLVELEALAKKFAIGLSALTINQINPEYAGGVFLDAIASLFNIERNPATYTKVTCKLYGVKGTKIPAGTRIFDNKGNIFSSREQKELKDGNVEVDFYCIEPGEIEVPANSITVPPSIPGIEVITQDEKGESGGGSESDAKLLSRLQLERFTGLSLFGNISSALNKIPEVISFKVYNNGNSNVIYAKSGEESPVGEETIEVDGHSVLIIINDKYIDGTEKPEDAEKEEKALKAIAEAIINNISAGCGYTALANAISKNVPYGGADGTASSNQVIFNRARKKELKAQVEVRAGKYSGDDLGESVKTFLVDWSNNKYKSLYPNDIGVDASAFYLANAMQEALGCNVEDFKIGVNTADETTIFIEADEIAFFNLDDITVSEE